MESLDVPLVGEHEQVVRPLLPPERPVRLLHHVLVKHHASGGKLQIREPVTPVRPLHGQRVVLIPLPHLLVRAHNEQILANLGLVADPELDAALHFRTDRLERLRIVGVDVRELIRLLHDLHALALQASAALVSRHLAV